jgi:predicted ATP-dependent endonuclease of OLD family
MKVEKIKELFKKAAPEVELDGIDFDTIATEWNESINGAIKAETERAKEKTEKELLSKYGFENEDGLKELIDSTKDKETIENEKLLTLEQRVEKLTNDLAEKDKALTVNQQKESLRKLNIKDDRLEKAYRLIASDVNEENDFETVAKQFVEDTPEWLASDDQRSVTIDNQDTGNEDLKKEDAEVLGGAWD